MSPLERLRVMSLNVRSFGANQKTIKEDVLRQKPHLLILQETTRWIKNDTDLGWPGVTIYNIPPVPMTRGNKGGIAVIVCPELKIQELSCRNPAAAVYTRDEETCDPLHTEQVSVDSVEDLIPEAELDLAATINEDARGNDGYLVFGHQTRSPITGDNNLTGRQRHEVPSRTRSARKERARQRAQANGSVNIQTKTARRNSFSRSRSKSRMSLGSRVRISAPRLKRRQSQSS